MRISILVILLYWTRLSFNNKTSMLSLLEIIDNRNNFDVQNSFISRRLISKLSQNGHNISCHVWTDYQGRLDITSENKNAAVYFNEELCQFALIYHCLFDHFTEGRLLMYFDDKLKYDYVQNVTKRRNGQINSFYVNKEEDRIVTSLRAFIILILKNSVDIVVAVLADDIFQLLLDIWIEEGYSKTISLLHISSMAKLYVPKCKDAHSPSNRPIKELEILKKGNKICERKTIDLLKVEINRCKQRKNPIQPLLKVVVRIEAPWIVIVPGFYKNGQLHCPKMITCSLPSNNGTTITWTVKCCSGFMVDLFLEIAELANIKNYFVYGVPDHQYGGIVSCPGNNRTEPTKCTWNGLFNELINEKADIALTSLTFNAERAAVSDITDYINQSPMGIVRHKTKRNLPLFSWQFAKTLDPLLAIAMLVTFLLICIVAIVIENAANVMKKRSFFTIHETLTYMAGLTFQRDLGGINPHFWSARLSSIMYAFATTIIMTTYTADLTAKGVVQEASDFQGLKDERITNPTSDFLFSLPYATNSYRYFYQNVDERYGKAAHMMEPYRSSSDLEGVEKVFTGQIDGFISDYSSMNAVVNLARYCSHLLLENFRNPKPYSFALRKNSKFTPFFSKHINELRSNGKIDILNKKWVYESSTCAGSIATAEQFGWRYAFGLVAILILTSLICVFVLFTENFCNGYRRRTVSSE